MSSATDHNPVKEAADFNQRILGFASHLAELKLVVARLTADWGGFGCWEIHLQTAEDAVEYHRALFGTNPMKARGPTVIRLLWDARDKVLYIQSSPTRVASVPNEWKDETAKGFNSNEEVFAFAEDWLKKHVSKKRHG
jgi:hypothetical protein